MGGRIKYRLIKYLGEYQKWLRDLYGRQPWRVQEAFLERFFSRFPRNIGLERFSVSDVSAYRSWRIESGTARSTIEMEIKALDRFWRYLIEDRGCKLFNPARPCLSNREPKEFVDTRVLRVDEFKRFLEAADEDLRQYIVSAATKTKPPKRLLGGWINTKIKRAQKASGLTYITMALIRRSLARGLWREIIREYCEIVLSSKDGGLQTGDPLISEPKPISDGERTVERPPLNVGPSIPDHDNNLPLITDIIQ